MSDATASRCQTLGFLLIALRSLIVNMARFSTRLPSFVNLFRNPAIMAFTDRLKRWYEGAVKDSTGRKKTLHFIKDAAIFVSVIVLAGKYGETLAL